MLINGTQWLFYLSSRLLDYHYNKRSSHYAENRVPIAYTLWEFHIAMESNYF